MYPRQTKRMQKRLAVENNQFRPCVGDLIKKGESQFANVGVVIRVFEDMTGDRVYLVQMQKALLLMKGPDYLTQEQLDLLAFNPATRADWDRDRKEIQEWIADTQARLYEEIRSFVETKTKQPGAD